jgi:23S rRNA (cytosine1962-C5)-methyltransferase
MTEINIKIKKEYLKKYQNGYPLIDKDAFVNMPQSIQEGSVLNLLDSHNKFVAKGYYGRQNKGYGWVLSGSSLVKFDKAFFKQKIKNAIDYRADFFAAEDTTAFRVFNSTGDGVGGLSIDYFDGYYLITWYSLGIYSFKDMILEALKECVDYKGIYHKRRFENNGQYVEARSDFVCGNAAPAPLVIKENGIKFAIYLDDGAMVGIFLDQREVRQTIRDKYAKDSVVLNTFSYTGAFSLYSAIGGAKQTVSVDLAKRSLAKTKEHFNLNAVALDNHKILVEDVFHYFKYAARKELKFDLVIADPPSFARSKKHTFSVAKDYKNLLKDIINITAKDGVIVASTNYAGLKVEKFKGFIDKAFKELGVEYKILQNFSLPKDFRVSKSFKEDDYLKVFFIKKLDIAVN